MVCPKCGTNNPDVNTFCEKCGAVIAQPAPVATHTAAHGHVHDAAAHAPHHPPTGFIRKYIFSLDHKVIGIQYYFLALTAVFVGMFLSLLMRIHLIWPQAVLPLFGEL